MRLSGRAGLAEGPNGGRGPGGGSPARLVLWAVGALVFGVVAIAGLGASLVAPARGEDECAVEGLAGSVEGAPRRFASHYLRAAARYRLGPRGPAILAAIHAIESDFSDGRPPVFGPPTPYGPAIGPMQFLASTWDSYGVDGDGDGRADAQSPADAIHSAAGYLSASGAPREWYRAIFAYNRADWYVRDVLRRARGFGDLGPVADVTCAPTGDADLSHAVRLHRPRAFERLPAALMAAGYAPQEIDARLHANAVWILRNYELRVTAAREAGHATHGDGTALDMVPAGDVSSQAAWDRSAGRLARDLGWRRRCGASGSRPACPLVDAIQFVGYEGYPSHGSPRTCSGGCPAHIHVSWSSSSFGSGALSPPPAWVMAFASPGAAS